MIVVFLNDDGQTINYYSYGLFWNENNAVKNIRKAIYTRIVNYRYMYMYIADLRSLEINMHF